MSVAGTIAGNIKRLRAEIPSHVKIIAISKTKPVADMLEAFGAGHFLFGENRVKEILLKRGQLPRDISLHMVGHLQTNKVKQLTGLVSMIHSVDSSKLLAAINSESERAGLVTDCLLQFHIAKELSKSGFTPEEADEFLASGSHLAFRNIRICGVMGMATFTDDAETVRGEFRNLRNWFEMLRKKYFSDNETFSEVSMGMSGDYRIAIEEGSTMVRIGSLIFGERDYKNQ